MDTWWNFGHELKKKLIRGKHVEVPEAHPKGAKGRLVNDQLFIQEQEQFLSKDIRDHCARNNNLRAKPSYTKTALISIGCAPRYFRHLPAMSINPTLHAIAPLRYPCWRYPKCLWGLYASPPPVAMAVVECFPSVFFPCTQIKPKKSLCRERIAIYAKKMQLTPKKSHAYFRNRATLSSMHAPCPAHGALLGFALGFALGVKEHAGQHPIQKD